MRDCAPTPKHPRSVPALALDLPAAARALSLSPRTVAELSAAGDLPSRRVGRRRLFLPAELREWLETLPKGSENETD